MKQLVPLVALTGALVAACAPTAAPTMTAAHAAAIRDSVQATLDAFQRYSAEGKWDSLATLYADDDDFRWLEQGMIQYRSAAQIREAMRRIPPTSRVHTSYFGAEIVALAPGAAAVATTFHSRFVTPGRPDVESGGVLNLTLVHREGGWRILMGHSSSRPQ